jgi:hypothetical protein
MFVTGMDSSISLAGQFIRKYRKAPVSECWGGFLLFLKGMA